MNRKLLYNLFVIVCILGQDGSIKQKASTEGAKETWRIGHFEVSRACHTSGQRQKEIGNKYSNYCESSEHPSRQSHFDVTRTPLLMQ